MSIANYTRLNYGRMQAGFNLIEMSIVLVIVGLVMGGLMAPLATQMENSRRNETELILEQLQEGIYGYALINGRLPCPDTNSDGIEDRTGNNCTVVRGELPWSTLALGNTDAWGQNFIYRVTGTFADMVDGTGCGMPTTNLSFSLCSTGDIQVLDQVAGNVVAANVPAVIASRGKNWASTPSRDERENIDNDTVFVTKNYSSAVGNEYDDMVVWVVPSILISRMVHAGRLP